MEVGLNRGVLKAILKLKMPLARIEKYIRQLPSVRNIQDEKENGKCLNEVKVAAVQREIKAVKRIENYIDMVNDFIVEACKQGCQLIVFPEYNFFDLFGLIPGFRFLNDYLNNKAKGSKSSGTGEKLESNGAEIIDEDLDGKLDVSLFASILRAVAKPFEESLCYIFSLLAKKHGIYVYTGSFLVCRDEELYNVGFLYVPGGSCVGKQAKLHLTDFEEQMGLARANILNVYKLDIGNIAFPVCMDATYFETFYAALKQGADLIVLPIANMEEYSPARAIRGIWGRVQESYLYGVKASLNGWIAGMHFTGKAGVFAPLELTGNKDGVLAISSHYEGNELVTCRLDYRKLRECRQRAEYHGDCNPFFEKQYAQRTYFKYCT